MKNLRGYLTAAVCGAITYIMINLGQTYSTVVDMIYPYIVRSLQTTLAEWSGQADFLIWQLFAVVILAVILTTLVLDILLKRSIVRWFGWVLACGSLLFMLHTAAYGMNTYAGGLDEDLRLEVSDYTLSELAAAARYYRDQANSYAQDMNRDSSGSLVFDDFDTLAARAASGFRYLTYERYFPVFAGSTEPVKQLGWAGLFSSMGVSGFTFALTGEAAVNPQIPDVALPYEMCHEMAHRMCIASERDADFAAFLACSSTANRQYQYSAYFMAYRCCYSALCSVGSVNAANEAADISAGVNSWLAHDLEEYESFFSKRAGGLAQSLAERAESLYARIMGDTGSTTELSDLLVMWHIQEVVLPANEVIEEQFDPYDETQVDLTGIVNARAS